MSGFKKQARWSQWCFVSCNVSEDSKEDLLVNDDATDPMMKKQPSRTMMQQWLLTYLGECFPSEFVVCTSLGYANHQGKMDAEYTTAMWSDAGVGVGAQRIIMKYFTGFFTSLRFRRRQSTSFSSQHHRWYSRVSDHTLDYCARI
jgi:hypothetical protein